MSNASGLVLDIDFTEKSGSVAGDASRYGNDGALTGCKWVEHGLEFNGSSDYVDCGNGASLGITDLITISGWVKITNMQACVAIHKANMYRLGVHSDGRIRPILTTGGTPHTSDYTDTILNTDIWYHLVMTYDKDGGANNEKVYINGDLDKSWTQIGAIDITVVNVEISSSISNFFNGSIDQFRIYNRALNASEIKAYYDSTKHKYM